MKKLLLSAALFGTVHFSARALTVSLDAEKLKDAAGVAILEGTGLVVLTAGTSGTFYGPNAASFASGDEIVLKKWSLSTFGGFDGVISDTTGELTFSGAWNAGDPLRMYWYPTLSLASPAPGADTPYGTYRDGVGIDGSVPWITGGPSDTSGLKFFTSDATLNAPGSNSASAGRANLTVPVPEPGAPVLILLTVFTAAGISRRPQRGEKQRR